MEFQDRIFPFSVASFLMGFLQKLCIFYKRTFYTKSNPAFKGKVSWRLENLPGNPGMVFSTWPFNFNNLNFRWFRVFQVVQVVQVENIWKTRNSAGVKRIFFPPDSSTLTTWFSSVLGGSGGKHLKNLEFSWVQLDFFPTRFINFRDLTFRCFR